MSQQTTVSCRCGHVRIDITGTPIVTAECHCSDCRAAAEQLEALPNAPAVMEANGGTGLVLVRKDRLAIVQGAELLQEMRLTPQSPTRRVVATCCNSAMFLDFTKGHWLSLYRQRFEQPRPAIEMRVVTKDKRAGTILLEDVPNLATHSNKFIVKLMAAWLKMGFRTPKLPDYPRLG